METFSMLLAICEGNTPVTGGFPSQWPVMQCFGEFFDVHLNKGLSKSQDAGDLRCHGAHYDITVTFLKNPHNGTL